MKRQLGTIVMCGAMLFSSTALFAQDYGQDHDRDHGDQRYDHGDHGNRGNHGDHGDGRDDRHGGGFYDRGRHEGWYRRGGRVPDEYRRGDYVVNDWHRDHLREPPRGYHWVRSDNGDFLLVAITTGVIASILAHQ